MSERVQTEFIWSKIANRGGLREHGNNKWATHNAGTVVVVELLNSRSTLLHIMGYTGRTHAIQKLLLHCVKCFLFKRCRF